MAPDNFFGRRRTRADLTRAAKAAAREKAMKRIRELLAVGPISVGPIAADLGLSGPTVYSYLCDMAEDGITRRVGDPFGHRPKWELGQECAARLQANGMRPHGAIVVPAVQVGMQRHWMDVALFGPAQGAAA
jgi:DNA-binding IclR family transcriptional regulator